MELEIINNNIETLEHCLNIIKNTSEDEFQEKLQMMFTLCEHLLQQQKVVDNNLWETILTLYEKTENVVSETLASNKSDETIKHCFDVTMKFMSLNGRYEIKEINQMVKSLLNDLLQRNCDNSEVITEYCSYMNFDDLKYYTLKQLIVTLKEYKNKVTKKEETEFFTMNVFTLLSSIRLPILGKDQKRQKKKMKVENSEPTFYCEPGKDKKPKFKLDYERAADLFASVWLLFLSLKIPTKLYRKILIILDDHVMPHFRNPLTLSDFLINSFDVGGCVSLLSLSSLFILIQKCNLEYPDFYKKLYSLFEPDILYVKYRARFFFWADVFLTSTHLPEYLVAAFIKRLSRMALKAPADALYIIIPFIQNLLVRHPNLDKLINCLEKKTVSEDPFDNKEEDPLKCKAIESSLWEIKTLQSHWNPDIVKLCSFVDKSLPKQENDLSEILETSFDEIVSKKLRVAHNQQG